MERAVVLPRELWEVVASVVQQQLRCQSNDRDHTHRHQVLDVEEALVEELEVSPLTSWLRLVVVAELRVLLEQVQEALLAASAVSGLMHHPQWCYRRDCLLEYEL